MLPPTSPLDGSDQGTDLPGDRKILEGIARGVPLDETLEAVIRAIEAGTPGLVAGICLIDADRKVVGETFGANLPAEYRAGLIGADVMNPRFAPCTAAVCAKARLVSTNISEDERWGGSAWLALARRHGFHHCESTPIFDSGGEVAGTFALYFSEEIPAEFPEPILSETAAHLASIAIARRDSETAIRAGEDRLRLAVEGADLGIWDWNVTTGALRLSSRFRELFGVPNDGSPFAYEDFLTAVHPEDRDLTDVRAKTAAAQRGSYDAEYRIVRPDGTERWIRAIGRTTNKPSTSTGVHMCGVVMDITQRREADESMHRFRFLAESLPDKIFTASAAGDLEYLSPQWATYTGRPLGEIFSRGWRDFVHDEDIGEKSRLWTQAMTEGTPFEFEHRLRRADGTHRWHLSRARPLRDPGGRISIWIGANTDIDDLKRAQIELSHREERFRALADATPVLIWMADITKSCTYFNRGWLEFTGRMVEQEVGFGWLEGVHPEDIEMVRETYDAAFEAREAFLMQYRLRHHSGTYRWILDRGVPRQAESGEFHGYVGGCVDIDEQRESQRQLAESESRIRLAVEASRIGFWDWNVGGAVEWSTEHNRILGIDPEQTTGSFESFIAHVHPDDRAELERKMRRAMENREDFTAEYRGVGPDGAVRWIAATGRAQYSESGRPLRVLGVVRDVTERKNFEDQLRVNQQDLELALSEAERARDEAEAAGRAKDQFLAVLSHELRTPLTPVLMACAMLDAKNDLPPDARDSLAMIRRNVELEARLIGDLLDLTRITRNQLELVMTDADLHDVIRQSMEFCAGELSAKSLNLELHLVAAASWVHGDVARLQQAFWNLLQNAVKFTPSGGRITVRTRNEKNCICVEVADTGIGISAEVMPHIFQPFEQGSAEFARQFGGLGLGLAISRATIEAHGGTLVAESPGRNLGAIFSVELALASAE